MVYKLFHKILLIKTKEHKLIIKTKKYLQNIQRRSKRKSKIIQKKIQKIYEFHDTLNYFRSDENFLTRNQQIFLYQ